MPTRKNHDNDPVDDRDDVADDTAPAERDPGGGFYADSPSDGPNRRGPDTGDQPDQ